MSISDFAARLAHTPVPWWMARVGSWLLAGYAVVTGIDLLHPPQRAAQSLTMVERIASLPTWGIWYLVAGGVLTLGLLAGRHALVWLGHLRCAGLYGAFGAATIQAVLEYQSGDVRPSGWIWRAAYVAVMIFAAHVGLCWLRGPIPRRGEEA
jgi:hypothetical protein